ncbi:flagellar hook-length control protein FliK [Paracoccus halophilus]|nr:flagellar hook-length control protein FliK [Paracoccus halophilus]
MINFATHAVLKGSVAKAGPQADTGEAGFLKLLASPDGSVADIPDEEPVDSNEPDEDGEQETGFGQDWPGPDVRPPGAAEQHRKTSLDVSSGLVDSEPIPTTQADLPDGRRADPIASDGELSDTPRPNAWGGAKIMQQAESGSGVLRSQEPSDGLSGPINEPPVAIDGELRAVAGMSLPRRVEGNMPPGQLSRRVESLAAPDPTNAAIDPDNLSVKEPALLAAEVTLHPDTDSRTVAAAGAPSTARAAPVAASDIARQIASGAAKGEAEWVEITLTPEELGKVRLVVTGGERPSISVYAEHRDTLDLLRRHSHLLAQELKDTGFGGADLSFADDAGAGKRQGARAETKQPVAEPARGPHGNDEPKAQAVSRIAGDCQIDIRI